MTPSPSHLAVFIRSLAGGGGAERMMLNLARIFAERGHRVDLVLARVEGAFVSEIPETVRLVDLKAGPAWTGIPALLRDPKNALELAPVFAHWNPPWVLGGLPALIRYLRDSSPDAMLSALNYTNITALWARRLSGAPTRLVVSERNTLSVRAASESRRRLRVLPRLAHRFYPWADAISAVSDGVADDLAGVLGLPRSAIHTTYNPVVSEELGRRAAEPVGHPWFAPDQPPVVLAAGKLKPQKDFETLLRAFAELRRQRPLRLVVLGEGPERSRLEALTRSLGIARDVAFPGFVENPFAFMSRAAVFVLSSAWEGLPGVLIQALACGCPCVSTDCPSGPREILEGGRVGPLVPLADPGALAAAVRSVLDDPPEAGPLREAARRFSADASADRYLELLLAPAAIAD